MHAASCPHVEVAGYTSRLSQTGMFMRLITALALLVLVVLPSASSAQTDRLTVERLFGTPEFSPATAPPVRWMKDGRSYLTVRAASGGGSSLVRIDVVTGAETVLADADALVTPDGDRITVQDVSLSDDESRALLFHNSVRVWRSNTRGRYHVYDFTSKRILPVAQAGAAGSVRARSSDVPSFIASGLASGVVDPDLLMFAKFSPDGRRVAYVRANDLWVTDLESGAATRLTHDGSDDILNGTTDWVYEEELGLRDAFRWSPDSRRIAYWRFDQTAIPAFPIVDAMTLYPKVSVLRYPKAGESNSRVTVGVIDAAGGETQWLEVGPDTGQYLARMDWLGADSLVVTRLPRRQNEMDLLVVSATSGKGRVMFTDRDSAYVDVSEVQWLRDGRRFVVLSDRNAWRQVLLVGRDGMVVRALGVPDADIIAIESVDETRGAVYVTAAAPDPTQRQLYRLSLDGRLVTRVTKAPGSHGVNISPDARWMIDAGSGLGLPPTTTLYELPALRAVKVLVSNAPLAGKLLAMGLRAPEFIKVPVGNDVVLDGYRITPAGFDSTRAYPVLMYVYGGPASPQVNHAWGGSRYLWHQLLAQDGYVVVVVDNRGSAWRGRDFRKMTQYRLGQLESDDQIAAAKWLGRQSWVDASRIGIWGWSYGGYLSALTAARGGSVFKAAIAVAPVTDFRLYDTIYTERFMWTPQENADGYRRGAPQSHVDGLTASLLLVHGTGDDNVHPQNTMQLANRLQAAGKPFEMMLYPNRTHSISGGNTQVHLFTTLTRFVKERL